MGQTSLKEVSVSAAEPADAADVSAGRLLLGIKNALVAESIGLLPAESFTLRTGQCSNCKVPKQKLPYFETELIAVPAQESAASGFNPGADRNSDVASWASMPESAQLARAPLVWIAAPSILESAFMLPGGRRVRASGGGELDMKLAPRLMTNRAYANSATVNYFEGRELRMRGAIENAGGKSIFVARTIWPKDFGFNMHELTSKPVNNPSDIAAFVRQQSAQKTAVETRLLWERHPGQAREWAHKPVLGIVLNGAQGDDNESLGGHFAVATGRIGDKGDWSNWAVNNFYSLDAASEKGIVAGTVPMDNYLMDLNSGQQYYRPSYMLVAVLNDQRCAVAYQGGVQRVFNHFYRHHFAYRHASANCAGISIDVFDALGWHIPKRGPTVALKSIGTSADVSTRDGSVASGCTIYDYLNEEQTRLFPAIAFEAAGLDLLQFVGATGGPQRVLSAYEEQLRRDVEAILLVRIPQVPSSRAAGAAPAFSFAEFRDRAGTANRHLPAPLLG